MLTWSRSAGTLLAVGVAALVATRFVAAGTPLSMTAVGGLQGTRYVPHGTSAAYEPSEDVAIDFDAAVDLKSFQDAFTVEPKVPVHFYTVSYGKRVLLHLRETPGTVYRLHVGAGVTSTDGASLEKPIDLMVKSEAEDVPRPVRSTPGEPYRYGVLAHPFPFSLAGPNAEHIVTLLAQGGVRFVRMGYCGGQIEKTPGHYDFTLEDHIADMLAAHGITEMPLLPQYCAPKFETGGFDYPAIFQTPQDYARFAAAVASHVAARYPRITRVEFFNEPNLNGWWTNKGDASYAAVDGSATAKYMLAAYAAVKAAAPRMTVVGPALANGGHEVDPRKFFEALYDNGCRRGACWDVLSVHNYRWSNPAFPVADGDPSRFNIYKSILAIAAAHGDPDTHVMLTEWGFSTIDTPDGFDPKVQALYVALGLNLMLADPLVDGIVYVNMWNPATDFWGNTSLVNTDFTPKPAFYVFRSFARDAR